MAQPDGHNPPLEGRSWTRTATLFQTTPQNITQHIRSVYEDGELTEEATCKQVLQVRQEGKRRVRRTTRPYSLSEARQLPKPAKSKPRAKRK